MTDKKKQLQLQLEHERKLEKRQQRCRDQRVFDPFDSPPTLVTPSQIQSSSKPLSVLEVANKFTVLGLVPKPSYQTTLVTTFDPFASSFQKTAFRHFDRPSPYHNKTPLNLFMIEPNSSHIKSPAALARKYFSPKWHYHTIHPLKTLRYYFDILLFTKSVRITSTYDDPNTKKKLLYHHFYVVRFISEDKWELPPYSSKELPKHDIPFSYHDYIDAWYKVFLYQFEDFSHYWFVQFDKYFKGSFPTWVLSWWQVHGPVHDIMPNEVKDAVRYFSTVYKIEGHQSLFPSSLHFFYFFRVPWILKWQYTFVDNCVARQFSVKWWDKYIFTKVQERLYSEFSGESQTQASPEALTQPEQVSRIQQAPKAPKKSSPSSSSKGKKSSSSKEKKQSSNKKISKKDLLAVVQAILSQASKASDDEELHREAEIWMKHYSSKQKILLVGEGDLSFSLCLAKAFGSARNMVATSFNTQEDLASMYKSGMRNVRELVEKGCLVLYKVDALQMSEDSFLKTQMFDRIVYNLPHAGFHGFFESDNRQIKLNKTLVEGFFKNAKVLLRKQGGEIHVTHKKGDPYDKWDLVKNAEKIGLVLHEEVPFRRDDYPGYNIKRGHGKYSDLSFEIGDCSTYKFRHPPQFANWNGY